MKSLGFLTLVTLLSACGAAPLEGDASVTQALSDARRIEQRPDGRYDVLCTDGRREIVTQADVQANNVCLATGIPSGTIVLADRNYYPISTSAGDELEVFGKGLWEGWINFKSETATAYFSVVDGAGTIYSVVGMREFRRLKLPVTINDGSGTTTSFKLVNITAEVTRVNDLPAAGLSGKFQMTSSSTQTFLKSFGRDLGGVAMTFRIDATFFDNFDGGVGCGYLEIYGSDRIVVVTAASVFQTISLKGPVSVYSNVSCTSSRRSSPENANMDFELQISNIQLGNPV